MKIEQQNKHRSGNNSLIIHLPALVRPACLLLLLCAAGAASGREPLLKGHPDSTHWASLFRPDLSDATYPKGVWTVEDGALTANADQVIWTTNIYEQFVLDLEFKTTEGANSGVIVYAMDTTNWIPNAIEIQILDDYAAKWVTAPKNWKCGGFFGHVAPTKQTVKKPGEWNRMSIACKGEWLEVWLNGERVSEMFTKRFTSTKKNPDGSDIPAWLSRPVAQLGTRGHIGLQGKHGEAAIFFRNVRIQKTLALIEKL